MADLCFSGQTLHISAPKLRYFTFCESYGNIYLEKAEDVEKLHVDLCDPLDGVAVGTYASTFQVFPDPCSKLCEITISNYVCKLLACCGGLQTLPVFSRLKKLTFSDLHLNNLDVYRCLMSFLAHSPNLKVLTILLISDLDNVVDISKYVSMVEEYMVVGINLEHLKNIEIQNCLGMSLEMNMIKLVLRISPVLQKMRIYLSILLYRSPERERKVLRKMLSFSRASGQAKIKIK